MKSIKDWKKDLVLEDLSSNECNLKEIINSESKMLSFSNWKIKNLVKEYLNEQSPPPGPGSPGDMPPPAPPPAPPLSGAAAPAAPPTAPPDPNTVTPVGQPNPQGPDDKTIISQLKEMLGSKNQDDEFPVPAALKLEAKKIKEKAAQKKLDSGKGLQMWLWNCITAWQKARIDLPQPQPPQPPPPPQPQQPGPPAPPPGSPPGPQPGQPGPQPQPQPGAGAPPGV